MNPEGREYRLEHGILLVDQKVQGKDPLTGEPIISIPGVYTMEGVMNGFYKPSSEIENPLFWRFFDGLPYRDDHPPGDVVVISSNSEIAGYIDRPSIEKVDGRPIVKGWTNIYKKRDNGKRALRKIFELGMTEVSIGFWVSPQRKEGSYHDPSLDEDIPYIGLDLDMKPDHVATVDKGACTLEMGCGHKIQVLEKLVKDNLPPFFKTGETPPKKDGVVPSHQPPKAPVETSWSFSASDGDAILNRGGWPAYKNAHTWWDSEEGGTPETKTAYKLPHHKVIGGSIKVVWRGVVAAAVAVQGGRTPLAVPAGDLPSLKRHLGKHYQQFDKEPPWDEEGDLREWLYPEEVEEACEALNRGDIDFSHAYLYLEEREEPSKSSSHKLNVVKRIFQWARKGSEGEDSVAECDDCETLEAEVVELKKTVEEAEKKTETLDKTLAEIQVAQQKELRDGFRDELEKITKLKWEKIEERLKESGVLGKEDTYEELPPEDLEIALEAAKLASTSVKPVASLGDSEDEEDWGQPTVGALGIDYQKKDGRIVPIEEA